MVRWCGCGLVECEWWVGGWRMVVWRMEMYGRWRMVRCRVEYGGVLSIGGLWMMGYLMMNGGVVDDRRIDVSIYKTFRM